MKLKEVILTVAKNNRRRGRTLLRSDPTFRDGRFAGTIISVIVIAICIYGPIRYATWLWLPPALCALPGLVGTWVASRDRWETRALLVAGVSAVLSFGSLLLLLIPFNQLWVTMP